MDASSGVACRVGSVTECMTQVYEQTAIWGESRLPKRKHPESAAIRTHAIDLPLNAGLFAPGDRVCVAVSGGADSTALLHRLFASKRELGVVLSVLHVEHGLRGEASRRDAAFVAALAEQLQLPCQTISVDTPKRAAEQKETIEEAARNLRYEVFRAVVAKDQADKIATAHTLDDQAETVLMKLLRGAWTEGLGGIHPALKLDDAGHLCVRPLLGTTRGEVEAYLRASGQPWCEDETNDSHDFMRNRVRHELLPAMREYNPQIVSILAHLAENARAEKQHWDKELARLLPQLVLTGKPVRGGGRRAGAVGDATVAVEMARLRVLDAGLRRRVLRAIARKCGSALDFEATERLVAMAEGETSAKRLELPRGLIVTRTARELQFEHRPQLISSAEVSSAVEYELPVPGAVDAPAFGAKFSATLTAASGSQAVPPALVRPWRPGDRVHLAHSGSSKKVKKVLERIRVYGDERILWPVVVWEGRIIWMRGVQVAAAPSSAMSEPRFRPIIGLNPTICEVPR